jgi:hypothetical protein
MRIVHAGWLVCRVGEVGAWRGTSETLVRFIVEHAIGDGALLR